MSKLKELLEGVEVEWKSLDVVTKVLRGRRLTRDMLAPHEKYPVFHGGLEPLGFYSSSNRPANTVMIINVGASAGTIGYCDVEFWSSDGCFCLEHTIDLYNKFLYYILIGEQHFLKSKVRVAGIPTLDNFIVEKLQIPIPCPNNPIKSLEIQKEIVRILDTFTERTETLIIELTTELEARKRQYNYYRDRLLSFDEGEVEWKQLDKIFDLKNGYTPSKSNQEYWTNGTIPWFRMEDIRENGRVLSKSIQYVNTCAVKGDKLFPANSIIVATSATIGEHALITVPFLSNQRFTNLSLKREYAEKFIIKFLFYFGFVLDEWCKNNVTVGNFAGVDMNGFKKFLIPIPSLEEQKRIVAILDKLENLTSSISEALPKEIALRKKQYEYYRDLLLTFPKQEKQ